MRLPFGRAGGRLHLQVVAGEGRVSALPAVAKPVVADIGRPRRPMSFFYLLDQFARTILSWSPCSVIIGEESHKATWLQLLLGKE